MSITYEQFTVELSLQHITMVRLSEHLLRNNVARMSDIISGGNFYDFNYWWENEKIELKSRLDKILSQTVDELLVPAKLKKLLRDYMSAMALRMFRCLRRICRIMSDACDADQAQKLTYFIANFAWDNFGCVDAKKMINAYVRNRATVDFPTWKLLCAYFCEDNIRRFFPHINWVNAKFIHTDCSALWYYKMTKSLPPNFYPSVVGVRPESRHCRHHAPRCRHGPTRPTLADTTQTEQFLSRKVIHDGFEDDNLAVLKYFLHDEIGGDKINTIKYITGSGMWYQGTSITHISEVYVYILGQIRSLKRNFLARNSYFMDWPWVYCVRSWKKIFQAYTHNHEALTKLMLYTFEIIKKQREVASQQMLYVQHCQIFEELWDVWYENSLGADIGGKAIDIGWLAFLLKDLQLCKIIFRKKDETRMHFLLEVAAHCPLIMIGPLDHDFWRDFMREVIVNDEERETFKDMFHHNSMKCQTNDDADYDVDNADDDL